MSTTTNTTATATATTTRSSTSTSTTAAAAAKSRIMLFPTHLFGCEGRAKENVMLQNSNNGNEILKN
jgi:hypothetical protein